MSYDRQAELPTGSSVEHNAAVNGSSQWKEMHQLNTDEKKLYSDMNGLLVGNKTLPELHLHDSNGSHNGAKDGGDSSDHSGHHKDRNHEPDAHHDHKHGHGGAKHHGDEKSTVHGSESKPTPEEASKELNADLRNILSDLSALSPSEYSKTEASEISNQLKLLVKTALTNYARDYSNSDGKPASAASEPGASEVSPTPTGATNRGSSEVSPTPTSTPNPSSSEVSTPTSAPSTSDVPTNSNATNVESTAGAPAGAELTKHVGDIVITKPGTVLDHMDIYGRIKIEAANVTIKDCVVHGDKTAPTYNTALIDCNSGSAKNVLIENDTLAPTTPSVWTDGVIGHDYTAKGVNTYNVVDGFGVYNNSGNKKDANVTIEDSYIHDLSAFATDPNHSDGTHNDGIQIQGGGNIKIIGNTIEAFRSKTAGTQGSETPQAPGSGILIQGNVSPVFDLLVEDNTIDGSKAGINVRTNAEGSEPIGAIIDNRLGRNELDYGNGSKYPIRVQSRSIDQLTEPLTSNVWSDTGEPLAVGRNLGIRYDS